MMLPHELICQCLSQFDVLTCLTVMTSSCLTPGTIFIRNYFRYLISMASMSSFDSLVIRDVTRPQPPRGRGRGRGHNPRGRGRGRGHNPRGRGRGHNPRGRGRGRGQDPSIEILIIITVSN